MEGMSLMASRKVSLTPVHVVQQKARFVCLALDRAGWGLGHLLSGHLRGSAVPQVQVGGGPLRGSARFPGLLALMAVC